MKDEGCKDEGKTMLDERFNQHRHTFILHPSSFILAYFPH
jgi:hypothetical protein